MHNPAAPWDVHWVSHLIWLTMVRLKGIGLPREQINLLFSDQPSDLSSIPIWVFTVDEPSWSVSRSVSHLLSREVSQCSCTIPTIINCYQVTSLISIFYDGHQMVIFSPNFMIPFTCISWHFTLRRRFFFSSPLCLCLSVFYYYLFWCLDGPRFGYRSAFKMVPQPLTCFHPS